MAITFTDVATANTIASASTLVASNITVSAGLWVVVAIAADNAGASGASSISSVTDSAGNTYTELSITNRTAGSASNDGTTLGIFLGKINTALSSGSITANFSPNTASKAMSIKSISVDTSGETLFYEVGAGVTGSGTAYSAGAVSVTNGYTIYGATALEQIAAATADSDTTNGSWSTAHTASADNGSSNSASQSITTQQKTVNATGNQTYNTSSGSTRDFAINYVIFYSDVPPGLTFNDLATATSNASSATLTTGSISVAKNLWIIVAVAADNAGTNGAASLTGVTDSAGNIYQLLTLLNQDPGAANEGTTLGIYLAKVTTALSSGTITTNFSPNTTCKVMSVKSITPAAGAKVTVATIGSGATGSGTAYSAGAISVTDGYTIYGATALEQTAAATADSDTTNGNWSTAHTESANGGSNTTSQSITTQQKTVTATGNQTYNTSSGSTRDYAINAVVLYAETMLPTWAVNGVLYEVAI